MGKLVIKIPRGEWAHIGDQVVIHAPYKTAHIAIEAPKEMTIRRSKKRIDKPPKRGENTKHRS